MISINGYFDGNVCIPLDKAEISPNQNVIITFLDSTTKAPAQDISGAMNIFGKFTQEEADKICNEPFKFKEI